MTRLFLLRLLSAAILAALLSFLITLRPTQAASLKPIVTTSQDLVTLGDLVDDAGDLAAKPVFRSPDAGIDGVLPASQAAAVVRAAGLAVDDPSFANIRVSRLARSYGADQVREMLLPALAERISASIDDTEVSLGDQFPTISADISSADPVTVSSLVVRPGGGFTAVLNVDIGAGNQMVTVSGQVTETMAVPVPLRPIARGEVIRSGDLTLVRLEKRRVPSNAILDLEFATGQAARRPLRANEAFSAIDIENPKVVLRNQLVTIMFQRPGMTLSARGRALGDAAIGETVAVINEQSHRTIQGIVSAAGTVSVEPMRQPALTQ